MVSRALIVGGGIGGLAAALACHRAGVEVALYERFATFNEVGAGIQLGPNVTKVLYDWGLRDALSAMLAFPQRLQVRSASSGAELGVLRLGATAVQRYGWPYATVHRADLHTALLANLRQHSAVRFHLDSQATGFLQSEQGVTLHTTEGGAAEGDLLVGADGLWSRVRQQLLNDGEPQVTGHLAYRALLRQSDLPDPLRSQQVTLWLGPALHVVQYPVRGGEWLNVVAVVQGHMYGDAEYWDHSASSVDLRRRMTGACTLLQDFIRAIEPWRLWALSIRAPMRGAHEQAQGRVALLGDAAHPMLPYLAQGAGMAIEDADALGRALTNADTGELNNALACYAAQRWQRNARVQARALRNGQIFHATGPLRWGRDVSMKVLGERVLDVPWLYRGAS